MATKAKAKKTKAKKTTTARAKAAAPLSGFCKVLSDGIKGLQKDIVADDKAITAQETFIQQLIRQGAKPAVVDQATQRLTMLQSKLQDDEAQLSAFQDEFAADCRH
jgi:hypothetical protein